MIDKEQYLTNMAEAVAAGAEEALMREKKKSKRANLLVDYNLSLVVYLYPAVLKYEGESGKLFSEKLCVAWKQHFPDTNVSPATFEQINGGFKRKFCYITTAACTTLGKPDDCYELNCFRNYRDTYLLTTDEGEAIVPGILRYRAHDCETYQPGRKFQRDLRVHLGRISVPLSSSHRGRQKRRLPGALHQNGTEPGKGILLQKLRAVRFPEKGGGQFFCPV